jgi:hypothetical protein
VRTQLARTLIAAVVALMAGSCTSASEPISSASPTAAPSAGPLSHGRISVLYLLPYPEGPPAYFCPHPEQWPGNPCPGLSRSDVTAALGAPVAWPAPKPSNLCSTGWIMKVIFVDRTRLVYGPCEQPSSIVALHDALLQDAGPN